MSNYTIKYQYLNRANNDYRDKVDLLLLVSPITPQLSEKWRCCQEEQREGMEDSVHEQPMMNYMTEGLISFLSAHGTLGDELRLMGCRELTWCCLFGRCILGWSAVCHGKILNRSCPLDSLALVIWVISRKQAHFFLFSEIKSPSMRNSQCSLS